MTNYYRVSPKWKKSVFEYQTYKDEEKGISFTTEEMYRWGHCVVKVEEGEELNDIIGDPNDSNNEFEFDHNMVDDIEVDDQCSFYFENPRGITTEELDENFEEDGYDYLEKFGDPEDFYSIYQGELDVEDVTEEYAKPATNT